MIFILISIDYLNLKHVLWLLDILSLSLGNNHYSLGLGRGGRWTRWFALAW